jgi:hypothetical protein
MSRNFLGKSILPSSKFHSFGWKFFWFWNYVHEALLFGGGGFKVASSELKIRRKYNRHHITRGWMWSNYRARTLVLPIKYKRTVFTKAGNGLVCEWRRILQYILTIALSSPCHYVAFSMGLDLPKCSSPLYWHNLQYLFHFKEDYCLYPCTLSPYSFWHAEQTSPKKMSLRQHALLTSMWQSF